MIWQETPEYRKLLERRLEITIDAEKDMKARNEILVQSWKDPVFFTNNFAWTFDPRTQERDLPFILMPKQEEYVRWVNWLIDNELDGLAEKSRDTGLTYTTLISVFLWRWLFHDFNGKVGSRTEDLIDKPGDPDTIFWKLRYNLKRFRSWMIPEGFSLDKNSPHMSLVRPDNGNSIMGEAAGPDFGRGGRVKIALLDELGALPFARAAWESCGATTNTRLGVSTPPESGRNSHMYHLSVGKRGEIQKFVFNYKDDLRKDEESIEKIRAKSSSEEFAREREISYEGSVDGKVYASDFKLAQFGHYEYNPSLPVYIAWDFGLDSVAIQFWQWDMKNDLWYLIDSYRNSNKYIEFYVPFVTGEIESGMGYSYDEADLEKIEKHKLWKKTVTHYGDPDVAKHSLIRADGKSTKQILQDKGIYVQSKPWAGRSHSEMKQNVLRMFRKMHIDEANEDFIFAISNAKYPKRGENSQSTGEAKKPIHDDTSHHRSALEYLCDNVPIKPSTRQQEESDIPAFIRSRLHNKQRNTVKSTNPLAGL